MPAEVAGERFYRPSSHGAEPGMFSALEARRRVRPQAEQEEQEEAETEVGDDVVG